MLLSAGLLTFSVVLLSHPWPTSEGLQTLEERFEAPAGYRRVEQPKKSFGNWLRNLPIKSGRPLVRLHNGRLKGNQDAQVAVIDIDVGKKDLQQCADAAMRLRAEYLWSANRKSDVCFRYTSGDAASWSDWSKGIRPRIKKNKVLWSKRAKPNGSYPNFRKYLDSVFMYAGTFSLSKELKRVREASKVMPGDVFIKGGFPGHAVIVLDVVIDKEGNRRFLLGQSYMPAQEIHVLKNPKHRTPWYFARDSGRLDTPEYGFTFSDLKRFQEKGCP